MTPSQRRSRRQVRTAQRNVEGINAGSFGWRRAIKQCSGKKKALSMIARVRTYYEQNESAEEEQWGPREQTQGRSHDVILFSQRHESSNARYSCKPILLCHFFSSKFACWHVCHTPYFGCKKKHRLEIVGQRNWKLLVTHYSLLHCYHYSSLQLLVNQV